MSDLLEELRRDQQYEKQILLFRKALPGFIVLIIAVILLMLGYNYFTNKQLVKNISASNNLLTIETVIASNEELAKQLLDEAIAAKHSHTAELAILNKVGLLIKHNQKAEALKLLEEVVDHSTYLHMTKQYAKLLWLNLILAEPLEAINQLKAEQYLKAFSKDDALFRGAGNILFSLWLIKTQQLSQARALLSQLTTEQEIPQAIKAQAYSILSNLESRND